MTKKKTTGSTDLYCCILGRRHHDTEDWVEDDAGDRTAVATQRVPFRRAWDPLFGVALLTDGPTQGDLLLCFIQFGFELHHLHRVCRLQVNGIELAEKCLESNQGGKCETKDLRVFVSGENHPHKPSFVI